MSTIDEKIFALHLRISTHFRRHTHLQLPDAHHITSNLISCKANSLAAASPAHSQPTN